RAGEEVPGPVERFDHPLWARDRPRGVHPDAFDGQRRRRLTPRVEGLAYEQLSTSRRGRQPVVRPFVATDEELEVPVRVGLELVAEHVGLWDVAERLVQAWPVGAGNGLRPRTLDRDVQPPC